MGTGVEPTVTYPTTIDTYLTILEAANAASSTLNGALAADTNGNNGEDDKILVALSTLFPVNGGYVLIDNELIYYTGISGNNLITIKRGVNGTTIASHVDGSTVRLMVSEKYHNLLVDALIAIQTELGISPSGTSVTVAAAVSAIRARLDALEVTTHTQNTDTHLGTVDQDIAMNTHKFTGLSVPDANGQSVRTTTKITEANLEDAIDKKHSASIIGTKEIDETDIANGKVLKYNSTSGKLEYETSSGGSSAWTDLSDTPSVLVARQMCVVNSGGTAFEFDSALGVELTSRTINFTTVDTATTAQAKIDAVGRYIPYGTTITFQFADGTCTLSAELHWNGFYGGGNLYIYGNTSETNATTLHTTQSVILDFDGQSCNGIVVAGCFVNVYIRNFKVMVNTSAWKVGIKVIRCPYAIVNYNYVTGTSTAAGEGINANSGTDLVCKSNYVSNTYMGLVSDQVSMLHSNNNDDTGTSPAYGLFANYTSIIGKEGTQPAGSVANESANTGSVIR